jgi:hypothetical protein
LSEGKNALRTYSFILAAALLLAACSKKDSNKYPSGTICQLKATVTEEYDMNCGTPVLFFEDSVALSQVLGYPSRVASVNKLPAALYVKDKKLLVCIAPVQAKNARVCITLYKSYPAVDLIKVEEDQ